MMKHRYLFLEIRANDDHVLSRKILKSRESGMRLMEKELTSLDSEVKELIYRDTRKHLQEFICTNGLVFIINRI